MAPWKLSANMNKYTPRPSFLPSRKTRYIVKTSEITGPHLLHCRNLRQMDLQNLAEYNLKIRPRRDDDRRVAPPLGNAGVGEGRPILLEFSLRCAKKRQTPRPKRTRVKSKRPKNNDRHVTKGGVFRPPGGGPSISVAIASKNQNRPKTPGNSRRGDCLIKWGRVGGPFRQFGYGPKHRGGP